MPTTFGKILSSEAASTIAQDARNQQCVVPGLFEVSATPASPVEMDTGGAQLRRLTLETPGACRVEFWGSADNADLATPGDYSAVKWLYGGTVLVSEPGMTQINGEVLAFLNASRYIKIDPTHGTLDKVHGFAT